MRSLGTDLPPGQAVEGGSLSWQRLSAQSAVPRLASVGFLPSPVQASAARPQAALAPSPQLSAGQWAAAAVLLPHKCSKVSVVMAQVYVVPYLIVNAWLVTITMLQHTCAAPSSPSLPICLAPLLLGTGVAASACASCGEAPCLCIACCATRSLRGPEYGCAFTSARCVCSSGRC